MIPLIPSSPRTLDKLLEQLRPVAKDPWFVGYYIDKRVELAGNRSGR